jgi:hypothetical protein
VTQDLNVRSETVKVVQEGKGKTLEHISIGNNFMKRIPTAQQLRKELTNGIASN